MKIITFLSDFGDRDWFVAAVKGEIFKITKNVLIVDVTHRILPHDIKSTAFLLKSVYKNFPLGTIHLIVVDPGVGSQRRPIFVQSNGYYFVGPDNGIFSYIYNKNSRVYEIMVGKTLSSTFHARDIFGPTAARLAKDAVPDTLGNRIKKYVKFEFPRIIKKDGKIHGEVIYIDHFGNIITNIANNIDIKKLYVSKRRIVVKNFYDEGKPNEIIAVRGSSGYYEIACNKGSACEIVDAGMGLKVLAQL